MAVSGIGSNYNNVYGSTYAAQKNEAVKKTETKEAAQVQAGNTKNVGKDKVSDYYSYLQKNYDCVKNGSVAISGSYLKQCANDPAKAKELEENLSFFKEGYESGRKNAETNARVIGARLVDYSESWGIDSKGNVTMMASTTVTSGDNVKGWQERKEEQEKMLREKREKDKSGISLTPKDAYISSEKSGIKTSGLYHMGQDENGNPKIIFDAPKKAEKSEKDQPKAAKPESVPDDDRVQVTIGNMDKVKKEIEKLKAEKKQLEQQLKMAEGNEQKTKELEAKLARVEAELSVKDTAEYKKQHAEYTTVE